MPENKTKDIEKKLEFLGLDLDNVPEILKQTPSHDLKPGMSYDEKTFKVYKYVPISKIKILLTRTNRLNTLQEKIKTASPLYTYLVPEGEEGILKMTLFLKMLEEMKIHEIEEIDKEQEVLENNIPFKVKYKENYLWQICYSEYVDTYYMLAPIEDLDCSSLFYLIKKQIEFEKTGIDKKIFVPISYLDYSKKYFSKSNIDDIQKYLWQFTKAWPLMYEVYDKDNNMSFQIVGETAVYEKVNSVYKIVLNTQEDAMKFYKLIKALFILEMEFPNRYKFDTKISEDGGLEFQYTLDSISKMIYYDDLSSFIKHEVLKAKVESEDKNEEAFKLTDNLEKLKLVEKAKEEEYFIRQKQVTTYLECKKSLFGRIRYFFKGKIKEKDKKEISMPEAVKEEIKPDAEELIYDDKEYYTIEDLIGITKILERTENQIKNTKLDIKAIEASIQRLDRMINNAKSYIEEIEEHKKSIFEFWRFVNEDKNLELAAPEKEESLDRQLEKTFDYEEDLEETGKKFDTQNRKVFSKEELDSLFIADTEVLEDINTITNSDVHDFRKRLKNLKEEALNDEILFSSEEFDIFGNITEDKTKINTLGNTKHREIKKSKFRILGINKKTKSEEYLSGLKDIENNLENAIDKAKLNTKLNAYFASTNMINNQKYAILYMNPQNAINTLKECDKINLYNIKLKQDTKAIPLTNIVYYDNANKTLPLRNECL